MRRMKCLKAVLMASRLSKMSAWSNSRLLIDRDLRQVMDELAALVEKGGVVFVALDDEPFAVGEARALAEIIRNAADQVARVEAVVLENPRQQRGRRGLAVGAGDDQRTLAANEELLEQFRQRAVGQLVVQHVLGFRVAARDGVADDDEVGLVRQVLLGVAGDHLDLAVRQERGHGRIDVLVGAGDLDAFFLHRRGG